MALVARIKTVTSTQTVTAEDGSTSTVDLSLSGQLIVVAEYVGSATPATVIHTQTFQLSASETKEQIADRVTSFGANVREARVRAAELTAYVGALIPIA